MEATDSFACGCPRRGYRERFAGAFALRRSVYTPGCRLGEHGHDEARIVFTIHGSFETRYGRIRMAIDPVRALYRPPFDEHVDGYPVSTLGLTVVLPPDSALVALGCEPFVFADDALAGLATTLSMEMERSDGAAGLVIEGLVGQVVGRLCGGEHRDGRCPRWIRRVREWLEDEYAHPPSLQAIARAVDRDVSHVATAFRATYGTTVGAYVRELRLWHARTIVDDPRVPLSAIAQRSGFADQSHFSRHFKRRLGLTPGAYRRRRGAPRPTAGSVPT